MRVDLESVLRVSGASKETLKISVIEDHRNEIARLVGKDWESLATFIGVPNVDVDDIKKEYREPLDRRLAMMRRWHELWGSEATYLRLVEGFQKIGRRDLIELVVQKPAVLIHPALREVHLNTQQISWFYALINNPVPGFIVLLMAFLMISIGNMNVINKQSTVTVDDNVSFFISFEQNLTNSTIFQTEIIASDRRIRNCSVPEGDLPLIHPLFVGRENDVHQVLHRVATAHIVNINGAPGFGKSTLAIHVGYEIVKNKTSVRYINVEDKVSFITNRSNGCEKLCMNLVVILTLLKQKDLL